MFLNIYAAGILHVSVLDVQGCDYICSENVLDGSNFAAEHRNLSPEN